MSGAVRMAPLLLLTLILAVALVVVSMSPPSKAQADTDAKGLKVIAVTSEASTAVGWYQGASPPGVPLQEALDKFGKEGYRVKWCTEPHIALSTAGQIWYILLEKD